MLKFLLKDQIKEAKQNQNPFQILSQYNELTQTQIQKEQLLFLTPEESSQTLMHHTKFKNERNRKKNENQDRRAKLYTLYRQKPQHTHTHRDCM